MHLLTLFTCEETKFFTNINLWPVPFKFQHFWCHILAKTVIISHISLPPSLPRVIIPMSKYYVQKYVCKFSNHTMYQWQYSYTVTVYVNELKLIIYGREGGKAKHFYLKDFSRSFIGKANMIYRLNFVRHPVCITW